MDHTEAFTSAATVALPPSAPSLTNSEIPDEGRFVPGAILGGRYRIIGLLGKGGMGEVYRATDLTLGQSVALKFLPQAAALSPSLLERFHGEVRVARQVSHPNVCRVYDIGEAEGMPFISMEYVDGEDLATLLLRIGRLPCERAVEIARRLCAGLAAAHSKGVIHRDLKPQNVMMNRRGEIVIMDFGLAAIAGSLSGAEARSGTPAYMAPEQLKGTEVTAKSDIYALGLVLYELFTGRRPFEADSIQQLIAHQEATRLPSMTAIAADIDPAVERVIRRCLDPDPGNRPPTALSIAAALPGGDPLAAALAAGETPSPELVANAGHSEGVPLRQSVPWLALALVCLLAAPVLKQQKIAFLRSQSDYPPDVLRQKARDIAAEFGYTRRPSDSALWFENRLNLLNYLNKLPQPRDWSRWFAEASPVAVAYREADASLVAAPAGRVDRATPAPIEPGMVLVELDGQGRLLEFHGNPYRNAPISGPAVAPESVFRAARLDVSKFNEITPQTTPANIFDQIRAWKGSYSGLPIKDVTVEMASWRGAVTSVKILWPWTPGEADPPPSSSLPEAVRDILAPIVFFCVAGFALLLARRNWKLQRADRRGAWTVGSAILALSLIAWAGTAHVLPRDFALSLFENAVAVSLLGGCMFFLLYIALEPALRARWPHSIVTWNRVLAGRWNDPQVAAHVLRGAGAGLAIWTIDELRLVLLIPKLGLDTGDGLSALLGTRYWVAMLATRALSALQSGLVVFFVFFILRTILRKNWLAALVAAITFSLLQPDLGNSLNWQVELVAGVVIFSFLFFLLLRTGLVATISAMFFVNTLDAMTLGSDLAAWYAPTAFATLAVMLGIVIYAFRLSIGTRQIPVE